MDTKKIVLYTRYVDVILIIYNTTIIHPHAINTQLNQIHDNIKLNPPHKNHRSTNYLDLSITSKQTNIETHIHTKTTTTEITINFLSNHPVEHKMAAFRYHISGTYSHPLAPEKKQKELEQIQDRSYIGQTSHIYN